MLSKQHHSVLFLWPLGWLPGHQPGWQRAVLRRGGKHSFNSCPYQLVNNKAQESCVPALLLILWMVLCFALHRVKPLLITLLLIMKRTS